VSSFSSSSTKRPLPSDFTDSEPPTKTIRSTGAL
jgi:hypothetical protein